MPDLTDKQAFPDFGLAAGAGAVGYQHKSFHFGEATKASKGGGASAAGATGGGGAAARGMVGGTGGTGGDRQGRIEEEVEVISGR